MVGEVIVTITELRQEYDYLVYKRALLQERLDMIMELLEEQGEQP